MTPAALLLQAIYPGCEIISHLSGRYMGTEPAAVLLLAIALQETGLKHRQQVPVAHARGWWQFEIGGGVAGVMNHPASHLWARSICHSECVPFSRTRIFQAIQWHDPLAAAFARLLLWTDLAPLPDAADPGESYEYYERNWRPGKPRAAAWPANHSLALTTVRSTA